MNRIKIFSGNSNRALAENICSYLEVSLGKAQVKSFSDGETFVEIEENVRGEHVFVIQSTSHPANHHIMELLVMIDAFRRASADRITAVIPYYGYARQDRKVAPRTPITAKLVADLLTAGGTNRVVSIDLHAGQIQGFYNIPFDHLYALPVLIEPIKNAMSGETVIVSPDAGGVERARAYAKRLKSSIAIIDKRRVQANVSEVMHLVGDVKGKTAFIIDDMIDTAGTVAQAVPVLKEHGALAVYAAATHPVLSGPAIERLSSCGLEKIFVTDTIPLSPKAKDTGLFEVHSVAPLLGEAIRRIHDCDSVSSLFA